MTHQDKLQKMYSELPDKGIRRLTFAPPVYRLLWKLGVEVPPPHFSSFIFLFLTFGISFGLLWGLTMWILISSINGPVTLDLVPAAVLAGILFGALMGGYFRYQARRYGLPAWKDFE
jgi:hypothetical protein